MKRLTALVFSCLAAQRALAGSVAGTGGSTEVTQVMNHVELMNQALTLKTQLEQEYAMVNDMRTNSKGLSSFNWAQIQSDLERLAAIAREGQAMSYSAANQDAAYRQKYPGYNAYVRENSDSPQTFSDRYDDWSKTNLATISAAMQAAQLQSSQFGTEQETMHQLALMSQTASGRQQALQVGHQIAAQEVGQLQKLRALVMAQMQMQANFMAKGANGHEVETAVGKKYFDKSKSQTVVGDEQSF